MTRNRTRLFVLGLLVVALIAAGYFFLQAGSAAVNRKVTAEATDDNHKGESHDEEEGSGVSQHIELSPEQIANANITIEQAGPARIAVTLRLNGIIGPNEERTIQIVPRYEGLVRAIHKRLGDPVREGESLVTIESNDSLRSYDVTAPIDGTVIARSVALGEFAGTDRSLFVVADLSSVWGNFSVYRSDFAKVKTGQVIKVAAAESNEDSTSATISYVSPLAISDTQSSISRAVLINTDARWRPGQFVAGDIVSSEQDAAVAVKRTALQTVEGQTILFVRMGEDFMPRAVELGASDDHLVEIRSGLREGEDYVATNSFILKSELGKSSAEHGH